MECQVVNDNEVKILLSEQETDEWERKLERTSRDAQARCRLFRSLLQFASEQVSLCVSSRMEIRQISKVNGCCVLYVTGWLPRGERVYLFESLDGWLNFFSVLSPAQQKQWGKACVMPSGRCLVKQRGGEEAILAEEFATLLTGEYLSCYLREHADEW